MGGSSDRDGGDSDNEFTKQPTATADDCDFSFETTLKSVKRNPLSSVSAGDILPIDFQGGAVVVVNNSGQPIGSITTNSRLLRECIDQGHSYEVEVLLINGGKCEVRVFHQ